jgi:hypothetical protein
VGSLTPHLPFAPNCMAQNKNEYPLWNSFAIPGGR